MPSMRIGPKGIVLRTIQFELTAEHYRRLEIERNRRGSSFNDIINEWLRPKLEALPQEAKPRRIET